MKVTLYAFRFTIARSLKIAVHMVGRVVTQQYTWLGGQLPSSTHGWEGSYPAVHMVGRVVTQQYTWLGGAVTQQYTWLGG